MKKELSLGAVLVATLLLTACGPCQLGSRLLRSVSRGTYVSYPVVTISPENATEVSELAWWHTSGLGVVSYAPDGRLLAVGNKRELWLYDAETLNTVRVVQTESWVRSVAFSPDGQTVATGAAVGYFDGIVQLWGVEDGRLHDTLSGHRAEVTSVAFSPDGRTLASASQDGTIRVRALADGNLIHMFAPGCGYVWTVAFSPSGQAFASGCDSVRIWDASEGTVLQTLEVPNALPETVAFSPDGATLAVGMSDNTARLWDVSDGHLVHTLEGHGEFVKGLAFSPDGRILATGCSDGLVRLWRVSDGSLLRTLEGHRDWVQTIAFCPDGYTLASGSFDGTIRLWGIPPP